MSEEERRTIEIDKAVDMPGVGVERRLSTNWRGHIVTICCRPNQPEWLLRKVKEIIDATDCEPVDGAQFEITYCPWCGKLIEYEMGEEDNGTP